MVLRVSRDVTTCLLQAASLFSYYYPSALLWLNLRRHNPSQVGRSAYNDPLNRSANDARITKGASRMYKSRKSHVVTSSSRTGACYNVGTVCVQPLTN